MSSIKLDIAAQNIGNITAAQIGLTINVQVYVRIILYDDVCQKTEESKEL